MLNHNLATNPYGLMAIIVVYVVIVSFVASNYVQLKYAAFLLIVSAAHQSRCCLAYWHGCQGAALDTLLPGARQGQCQSAEVLDVAGLLCNRVAACWLSKAPAADLIGCHCALPVHRQDKGHCPILRSQGGGLHCWCVGSDHL